MQKQELIDLIVRYKWGSRLRVWDIEDERNGVYLLHHVKKDYWVRFDYKTKTVLESWPDKLSML